jgi:L-aminopeptidase/D-esterase-like protein
MTDAIDHPVLRVGRRSFAMALAGLAVPWSVGDRRARADASAPGADSSTAGADSGVPGALTDVPGVTVGHFTDARRPTGCTAVLTEEGAVCGVDVRGGAPGTRETALLDPVNTVSVVHGLVLAGGSAFGLDAASGVVRLLEERGRGFAVGAARVPIVPAAILFDLAVGDGRIRPDAAAGYAAARAAAGGPVAEGNVGAGAGATVGKLWGLERAMKGGLGTASLRLPGGLVVAALAAVNAVGDVLDPADGRLLAGARSADGTALRGSMRSLLAGEVPASVLGGNTTLAVVATNASLTKAQATRVATMAHDGLARAIQPVHTPWDGDTVFALTLGRTAASELLVGALAAEVTARAIVRAVRLAKALPNLPSAADLAPART